MLWQSRILVSFHCFKTSDVRARRNAGLALLSLNFPMKKLILILCLFFSFNTFAEDIKVLTWNVFMLPKPIKFTYQAERTTLIGEELNKGHYDVIFLQEAFPGWFHKHIYQMTKAKYPHQHYLKRPFISHTVFGSGLYVMSKFPIKDKSRVYYSSCRNADCFAAKGLSLITFQLAGGKEIQIGNTHLQAGQNYKSDRIRMKQLNQVKKHLASVAKPGVPQVILGDINIDAKDEDYPKALKLLNMSSTPLEGDIDHSNGFPTLCYNKPGDDEKEWIDHIWISKNSSTGISGKKVKVFSGLINNRQCPLSDHYGVEATLHL